MLVVGSRGAGSFAALVLGSVSRYVGRVLAGASARADLVVLGRNTAEDSPNPGTGAATHAVLNHSHGPVAVVPE